MDSMLETAESIAMEEIVVVKLPNEDGLRQILEDVIDLTEDLPHAVLLDLYSVLSQTILSFAHTADKSSLHKVMIRII